jgi:hypothetical protein
VSPLGVLVPNILSEEVWGRESVGLGFSSNPKFRVFLRKSKVRASFHYFGVLVLTVALRSSLPLVSLCRIFCLRRFGDVSRVGSLSNLKI